MAIEEKEIGHVTIDNEVSQADHETFQIGYSIGKDYFTLSIPRQLVEREFHNRGKARGVCSYYSGDDLAEHELTFEEFETEIDYRDEFDRLIQDLAGEQLNIELLKEAKEINLRLFAQNHQMIQTYEAKVRDLEKQLYQATKSTS